MSEPTAHHFFKAQPIWRKDHVESVTIVVDEQIPDGDGLTVDEYRTTYLTEADRLADVLIDSLPGGTIDALLIELMQRRASLLRVPFLSRDELNAIELVQVKAFGASVSDGLKGGGNEH